MSEASSKTPRKLSEYGAENRILVIEVLKAGIVWRDMLSDFERRFINETAGRYAAYGDSMTVVGEQWKVYTEIARKLNLKSHV
jgi:hypothetical protein